MMAAPEEKKPVRLDPEKFGAPPQVGDYLGIIAGTTKMYQGAASADKSRPFWVKIFGLLLGLALFLIGAFFAVMGAWAISQFSAESISGLIPLLIGLVLCAVGIRIIFANVKSLR